MLFKRFLTFVSCCLFSLSSISAPAKVTYWDDLLPQMEKIEDPFEKLTGNQMFDLATIARYREVESQEGFVVSSDAMKEVRVASQRLEAEGVDIERLFVLREKIMQQRERFASQVNDTVLNQKHRIPGFVTPIEITGTKVTKFFLVPTAGACIHTPPPPANQLILIDYPQGMELISLATPVWVEGELKSQKSTRNVSYYDGSTDVDSVYVMAALEVEKYEQ